MATETKILETTLRDGSYAVDFKFTPKDTATIASALEQIGFELIEVGHGLGLHALEKGKGEAAARDVEYLEAASSVLKKAKFGMFCIPGIARLEDIDIAAEYGMHFIRIGTNINELEGTSSYFERAKKHNMYVSSNLMKSYAVSAKDFGRYTNLAQSYGADIAVLVDSAGGLFPKDIEEYFKYSKDECDIQLGFHGHNNLGLAIANTLKAVELGAAIIDTSLKGIGRSAGNAATEMMVIILKKLGYKLAIDEYAAMDLAEKYISPLIHSIENTPISITTGYAQFHSSFMGTILKYAEKYRVDPRELIVKLTEKDKVHAPESLVEQLSFEISKEKERTISRQINPVAFHTFLKAREQDAPEEQIKLLTNEIINESKKKGKKSILNIVLSDIDKNENFISGFIQESPLFITGSIEIAEYGYIKDLVEYISDKFDYLLIDSSIKKENDKETLKNIMSKFGNSTLLLYNDLLLWAKSVVSFMTVMAGNLINKKIVVVGKNRLAEYLLDQMMDFGADVRAYEADRDHKYRDIEPSENFFEQCNIIVSCSRLHKLAKKFVCKFLSIDFVFDAKINSVEEDCIDYLNNQDIKLIRPDMRSAIAGEILHQISNFSMVRNDLGRSKIEGYNVVSGGLVGKRGEIVVDSISGPTRVIGVAQGNGKVSYWPNDREQKIVGEIQNYINSKL